MIIVKNRELLIPNNERYIGTTYDTETENRIFQVPRYSQRGVDLAALTFRLDIQYANESYDTIVLDKEIGEAFVILIWRITSSTLQVPGTMYIGLRAVDNEATVKWSSFSAAMYVERHLNTPGNYGGGLTEIEQMEQDHVYMKGVVDELKSNLDYAHDAEAWAQGTRSGAAVPSTDKTYHKNSKYYKELADTHRQTSERFAKGTVNGTAVTSGDGYHDNSKYYKELADAHRKTAERFAKGTENGTAVSSGDGYQDNARYYKEQVQSRLNQIDTNTSNIAVQTARIDNIAQLPSGSTSGDAELMDIRVGADGVTYTSAGAAVRANDSALKSQIKLTDDAIYSSNAMHQETSATGWRLNNNDGLCSASDGYQLIKYQVAVGDIIKVESDDRFQFQTVASVPSTGTSNRVGGTYGAGTYYLEVPATATYLIISTPTNGIGTAYTVTDNIDTLKSAIDAANQGLVIFDPALFVSGHLNVDGTVSTNGNNKRRCASNTIFEFNYPITFHVKSGSRIGLVFYAVGDDSTVVSYRTDIEGVYSLPANTRFKIEMYRKTEDFSEIANVDEFVAMAPFTSEFAYSVDEKISPLYVVPELRNGSIGNAGNASAICTKYVVPTNGAKYIYVKPTITPQPGYHFLFAVSTYSSSGQLSNGATYLYAYDPYYFSNDPGCMISVEGAKGIAIALFERLPGSVGTFNPHRIATDGNCLQLFYIYDDTDFTKDIRNGSLGNGGNANAVSCLTSIPVPKDANAINVYITGDTITDDLYFNCDLWTYSTEKQNAGTTSTRVQEFVLYRTKCPNHFTIYTKDFASTAKSFAFAIYAYKKSDDSAFALRWYDAIKFTVSYSTIPEEIQPNDRKNVNEEVERQLDNARHIKGFSTSPLTILHFSDLHSDTAALKRIMSDADIFGSLIDGKICTGDIVANTYAQITSWWDPSVMTCIGNHDTASYTDADGYDWTALSMANRDAYYIAPFESNWGITHTSGTSYYYKDYATQKVRLIVMDVMLYSGTPGAEATAQTSWLASLLSDAITNNLHVLIAIHAPHGGSTADDCSFSRYNQTDMPALPDCDTPQTVIDTVASAITSGLHFIGYLVGHTHQDNIWDAEDDGKQLMYCVTCAAVAQTAQWKNSDQNRNDTEDAYNLVTIDTENTLVKIVRGGGANIDDHMRTRKAICFNYTTGEKVGEVL